MYELRIIVYFFSFLVYLYKFFPPVSLSLPPLLLPGTPLPVGLFGTSNVGQFLGQTLYFLAKGRGGGFAARHLRLRGEEHGLLHV